MFSFFFDRSDGLIRKLSGYKARRPSDERKRYASSRQTLPSRVEVAAVTRESPSISPPDARLLEPPTVTDFYGSFRGSSPKPRPTPTSSSPSSSTSPAPR